MTIIEYEDKYRDDLIFMVLQAKDALVGKVPTINEDLLDVNVNYFQKGDKFWLAVDGNDRVVGSIGFRRCKTVKRLGCTASMSKQVIKGRE